ncbi:uncharacterized protein LOC134819323 isoform X2 [Bolinopsis microptera]|uniref:uncharacterized protein LOC134819323 isoform X2 n=1 Tax=Bolinopsis microptera TaxID=2820187 RepID=UPI00307AF629
MRNFGEFEMFEAPLTLQSRNYPFKRYIKLTLQCPHKGTGTLATCEHFPIVPRSTPRDYPPPRVNQPPPDNTARVQVIETKARQAVSKQELSTRISREPLKLDPKDSKDSKHKEIILEEAGNVVDSGEENKDNKRKKKKSTIHTVPLPPDPVESSKEIVEEPEKKPDHKTLPNTTSLTRSPESLAKHQLREKLQLHRRSHDQERIRSHKKTGSDKDKKVIKKRLKDSDNYVLEQGKIIKRKASFSSSFSALPTGSLFEMPVFAHDDDVFEKIVAEGRRAEFFGSSEEMWPGDIRDGEFDNDLLNRKKKDSVERDLCLQLSQRSSVWEKDDDKTSKIFVSGNSNLKHTSSEESSRIKTSNLSLGSKEFLSLKKNRRISKTSKTIRSYSLSKAKDYHKKRAKRTKFATTSESEEVGCYSEIDCLGNDITTSLINADVTDAKKKRKGKKTPMEFEKRLIAGTKRYYMTKLEKMKSKVNLESNQISSETELRRSVQGSGRELTEASNPLSLVSIPSQTCRSPLVDGRDQDGSGHLHQGHSPGSHGSKKPTPVSLCHGGSEDSVLSPINQCRTRSSSSTPVYSHCGRSSSRPTSCVISISRLKNVRVGPSIKERFCNSLVFIEKPSKPERSRFLNVNDEYTTSSFNDGFAAQLKASKIKLHRELALEERLTPNLTPAWTFSYMPPTSPSYTDYINSVDIQT